MRRRDVLGGLIAIGALSLTAVAYEGQAGGQQQAEKTITVDQIKENLWVLRGGGGNTAVFATANGVVVVDTKLAGWGQPILAKIKELTPRPVTTIINTHSHGDHVSGNVEFPATVQIVAHSNTKTNVEAWPPVYGLGNAFPNVVKESGGKGVPMKTFQDKLSLGAGNDRVDLFYFGRGHTGGDAWVVFPSLRVMHAGDMFPNKNVPIMDKNAGGSGVEFPETLMKAFNGATGVDTIITGHTPTTMTMADLKTYAEFNRDFVTAAREAKKAGRTVDDFAAAWKTPEKYAGYGAPQAASVKNAAQVVFDETK
jgi:glyoxylase-like metal-dependent hydrolase (beta-lactamase superfamily II)